MEEYVSFEIAKLARENFFGEPCLTYYTQDDDAGYWMQNGMYYYSNGVKEGFVLRPTQAVLQKWLREEHGIFVEVQLDQTSNPKFAVEVFQFKSIGDFAQLKQKKWSLYSTYEDALEVGLLLALKAI